MSNEDFNSSLKAKLITLFSKYKDLLTQPEQQLILQNNFVFSEVDPTADVLVMGINPSLRNDFVGANGYSYNYKTLQSDRYFKKFYNLLSDFEDYGITYCDLFYQRHTEQKQLRHFLTNDAGQEFLKEQLLLTREVIDYVSPRLILLFNRQGAQFFTQDWLGYDLEENINSIESEGLNDRLTNIKNTNKLIYFSAFLGYRTPQSTYTILKEDLKKLHAYLNS